jgi:predicted AAA+ superfamily ATPase
MNSFNEILKLSELAKNDARHYPRHRSLFDKIVAEKGKHQIGIVGPRGAGKTVLLKQLHNQLEESIYISLDTIEHNLFDLVQQLSEDYGYATFLLDEIHFSRDHDASLKKIYDFLRLRVVFTSSTALAMSQSAHDLSRRVALELLPPFSFREYLSFTAGIDLPRLTLEEILARQWLDEHMRQSHRFEAFLLGGNLPFALEEPDPLPLLSNILEKILLSDLPSISRLTLDEIETIRKIVRFIGRAHAEDINYSTIARNLGITKYKAQAYLELMSRALVLHVILPAGTNVLREPKVLMQLPYRLLYRELDDAIGPLREDFFADMLRGAGVPFRYVKSTRGAKTPDYLVQIGGEPAVVEIGGKGKGRSQFKGVNVNKKMIFAHTDRTDELHRPLLLAGFLY